MLFGSRLIWINARRWRHPISPLQDVVGIRVKGHAEMNDSYMSAALAVLTGAGMLMGGAGLAEAGQDFTLSNGIQASQTLNFDKFNTSDSVCEKACATKNSRVKVMINFIMIVLYY